MPLHATDHHVGIVDRRNENPVIEGLRRIDAWPNLEYAHFNEVEVPHDHALVVDGNRIRESRKHGVDGDGEDDTGSGAIPRHRDGVASRVIGATDDFAGLVHAGGGGVGAAGKSL